MTGRGSTASSPRARTRTPSSHRRAPPRCSPRPTSSSSTGSSSRTRPRNSPTPTGSPARRSSSSGTNVLPESEWIYDFSFPKNEGKPNPHLWTDPTFAIKYAEEIRKELTKADPDGAASYQANYDVFNRQATALSDALKSDQASLAADERELLTYHDAYAYFARTYGWTVIGAIQPENFEDPTPREIAELIDQVREAKVAAIFGSEVFPSKALAGDR